MALMLLATACGSKKEYTVEGHLKADGFDGQKVYLIATDGKTVIDSSSVVDGLFLMNGTVTEPSIVTVQSVNGPDGYYGEFVLEPGKIYIDIVNDSLSGTPLNDKFAAYHYSEQQRTERRAIYDMANRIQSLLDEASQAALMPAYDSMVSASYKNNIVRAEKFFSENNDNLLGAYAMNEMAHLENMGFTKFDSLMKAASPAVSQYQPNQEYLAYLRVIEQTSAGHPCPDVEGKLFVKGADGKYAQGDDAQLLTLIKGHVAIVDFWASWCGPCKQEIRDNITRIAKKYEKQGLVVVGIDLHDTDEGLAKAMTQLNVTYPVMVAGGDPGSQFGFQSIPQIFLIGADGVIIARDLRGDDIEQAVTAALGVKK